MYRNNVLRPYFTGYWQESVLKLSDTKPVEATGCNAILGAIMIESVNPEKVGYRYL